MLSKERFVYLINFIEKHYNLEDSFCKVLEQLSPGEYVNAYIYGEYSTELIKTIKDAMDLPDYNEDIEYFICDLNFGKDWKPDSLIIDKESIDISTPEKLYDFLINNR